MWRGSVEEGTATGVVATNVERGSPPRGVGNNSLNQANQQAVVLLLQEE